MSSICSCPAATSLLVCHSPRRPSSPAAKYINKIPSSGRRHAELQDPPAFQFLELRLDFLSPRLSCPGRSSRTVSRWSGLDELHPLLMYASS
jgi:hypothetical protein